MAEENENNLIIASCYFDGYKTKGNFDVEINFKFPEEQLANSLQFMAGIGNHLKVIALVNEVKVPLGTFTFYNYSVDRDANSKIRFKSNIDDCIINNFAKLMVDENIPITLKAKVVENN